MQLGDEINRKEAFVQAGGNGMPGSAARSVAASRSIGPFMGLNVAIAGSDEPPPQRPRDLLKPLSPSHGRYLTAAETCDSAAPEPTPRDNISSPHAFPFRPRNPAVNARTRAINVRCCPDRLHGASARNRGGDGPVCVGLEGETACVVPNLVGLAVPV